MAVSRNNKARLWLKLHGDFQARNERGQSVLPSSRKGRALLLVVATARAQQIARDAIAALLWSRKTKEQAASSLRQALHELLNALAGCGQPPVLASRNGLLLLQPGAALVEKLPPMDAVHARVGHLEFCQDLHGLDPAFDSYIERVWRELPESAIEVSEHAMVHREGLQLARPDVTVARHEPTLASYAEPGYDNSISALASGRAVPAPDKVSGAVAQPRLTLVVLPFRSPDASLVGELALGLAEEITAALSRFRVPRLIATASFWAENGRIPDAMARCRAYQVNLAIDGVIQRSEDGVRVTVNLIDVDRDFELIWTSRFEGKTSSLFKLQDDIASSTAAQIDPSLLLRQYRSDGTLPKGKPPSHELMLNAISGIYRLEKPDFLRARDLLLQAIALDRNYAAAYAWLAYWHILAVGQGWADNPAIATLAAGAAAEQAVRLDPLDARGLAIAGHVKAYLHRDLHEASVLQARALSLNPNLPIAWAVSSWASIYNGQHEDALERAETARSLSPADPHIFFVEHAAMTANFFLRRLNEADLAARGVLQRKPMHVSAMRVHLAILGHLGESERAKNLLSSILLVDPNCSIEKIVNTPPLRPEDAAYYAEGLRLAGASE